MNDDAERRGQKSPRPIQSLDCPLAFLFSPVFSSFSLLSFLPFSFNHSTFLFLSFSFLSSFSSFFYLFSFVLLEGLGLVRAVDHRVEERVRVREQVLRRVELDELALVEDHDAVGHQDGRDTMGDG